MMRRRRIDWQLRLAAFGLERERMPFEWGRNDCWWNIDRRLWRLFSPFLSAGLALAVGALIDAGVLGLSLKASSEASYFSLGFVAGYFADSALRKMKEIADTVFGSPERHGSPPKNSN